MSIISEQVKELRYKADIYNTVGSAWELNRAEAKRLQEMLRKAADTIESLSAKLQAKEYCDGCPGVDIIEIPCTEECKRRHFKAENMQRSAGDCGGGWIYCGDGENLPKEPFACIVTVIDTDPMTMTDFEAILPYQVGYSGGTWNDSDGRQIPFDVIAWMKAPTEPYHEP